jgi:hypothetical protein
MIHLGDRLHNDNPPWLYVGLGWALGIVTSLVVFALQAAR